MQLALGYFLNVLLFLKLPLAFFHFVSGRKDSWRSFVVGWERKKIVKILNLDFASGSSEVIGIFVFR